MQLKELLKQLQVVRVEGPLDREIAGLVYDSRRVMPGMVFVAIPGTNVDGHDFINTAIARGAAAIICERNGFTSPRVTKIKVADARETLARAAASFYHHPSTKLQVIGVTGTNGKTTVAFMIKDLLEASGVKTGLLGTLRNRRSRHSRAPYDARVARSAGDDGANGHERLQGVRDGSEFTRAGAKARRGHRV
jgi:UDP-N-acetylmuramoyl-L-alanyl-D-glutamate--2,6-diaminopimelate ligase